MLSSGWVQTQVGLVAPQGEETTGREACLGTQMSEDKPWTTGHRWTALGDKRGACGWKVVAYVFSIKPRVGIQ